MLKKRIITHTVACCLALLAFTMHGSRTVCRAGENKAPEEMNDAELLQQRLEKSLREAREKGEDLFAMPPKKKAEKEVTDTELARLLAEKPTDAEMVRRIEKTVKNRQEKIKRLKVLADRGNYKAMFNLGEMMTTKSDPYYDIDEAFRLMITAAKAGEAQAQHALAVLLGSDPYMMSIFKTLMREQFRWYYAAAEQGYAPAQQQLGRMLVDGDVLKKYYPHLPTENYSRIPAEDFIGGYMWLTLAISRYTGSVKKGSIFHQWNGFAQDSRAYIVKKGYINPAQINDALKRADQWEKDHPGAYKVFPVKEREYY